MSNLETICNAVKRYRNAIDEIEMKRATWRDITKPMLQRVLGEVVKAFAPRKWSVHCADTSKNWEAVSLQEEITPSGIVLVRRTSTGSLVRYGAGFNYALLPSGNVFASGRYPYVDEIQELPPRHEFGHFDPRELDESTVYGHVEQFLQIVADAVFAAQSPFGFSDRG